MTRQLPLRALIILSLSAFALALAGCGSSDSSDENAAAAPLTKTELVTKADAICTDMQKKLQAITAPQSIGDLEAAINKQIQIASPAIEKLKALNPPENLSATYDQWTARLKELEASTKKVRDAAASGSEKKVQKVITDVNLDNTNADQLAKKLGFKACAN